MLLSIAGRVLEKAQKLRDEALGIGQDALERVVYEVGRAQKVLPTLLRLGRSELEDLLHRIRHLRGSCDHIGPQEPRHKNRPKAKRVRKRRSPESE